MADSFKNNTSNIQKTKTQRQSFSVTHDLKTNHKNKSKHNKGTIILIIQAVIQLVNQAVILLVNQAVTPLLVKKHSISI